MDTKKTEQKIQLNGRPPIVAADGNSIAITDQGYGDLIFFQVLSNEKEFIRAQGVGGVRLSVEQLKSLAQSINHALTQHEATMKARKK